MLENSDNSCDNDDDGEDNDKSNAALGGITQLFEKVKEKFPNRHITTKRPHNISVAIKNNQQSSKKAGRSMNSVTTYPNLKKIKVKKQKKEK